MTFLTLGYLSYPSVLYHLRHMGFQLGPLSPWHLGLSNVLDLPLSFFTNISLGYLSVLCHRLRLDYLWTFITLDLGLQYFLDFLFVLSHLQSISHLFDLYLLPPWVPIGSFITLGHLDFQYFLFILLSSPSTLGFFEAFVTASALITDCSLLTKGPWHLRTYGFQ